MNWSCAVICSLSISWWDYNVSIMFVVACGLPRLALSYGLFSRPCIPQARGMCSVCPKNGTCCSSHCVKTPVLGCEWETESDAKGCERVWQAVKGNKRSTMWKKKRDTDTDFNRGDEPEFDPSTELDIHRRDRLQTDCKVIQCSRYNRGHISTEKYSLSYPSLRRQNGLIGHSGLSRLAWRPLESTL